MVLACVNPEVARLGQDLGIEAARLGYRGQHVAQQAREAVHALPERWPDAFTSAEEEGRERLVERGVLAPPGIPRGKALDVAWVGRGKPPVCEAVVQPSWVAGVVHKVH